MGKEVRRMQQLPKNEPERHGRENLPFMRLVVLSV